MPFACGLPLRLAAKRDAGSAAGFEKTAVENTAYDGLIRLKSAWSALWHATADTVSVGVY